MVRRPAVSMCLLAGFCFPGFTQVHHYVYFNRDRGRIRDASFLGTTAFSGAQLKYTWRELEPEKGRYDFEAIAGDLGFLTARHKSLFIQIQDVSFDPAIVNVPDYLRNDPHYGGGAARQYEIPGDDESKAVPAGWVARRWDPTVQDRWWALLAALGSQFDGKIAGINLPETAVTFGSSGRLFPAGFSFENYRAAILLNMAHLKGSFPRSVTVQYANFMPGEWRPGNDRGYLSSIYRRARELGVGIGGPDLLPYKRPQMNHAYSLMRESRGAIPSAIAVQADDYSYQNPQTHKTVTIAELLAFARGYLGVNYLFWEATEPFYSQEVVPAFRSGN
jgi:hypothetical protein